MITKIKIMKTLKNILNIIDLLLTRWAKSYIHSVSRTLYPRPDLEEDDDDDNEPILFI